LFIYFIQAKTKYNKQGYGLDRKGTWKHGKLIRNQVLINADAYDP